MLEPHVPEELTSYIVEAYVALRAQSGAEANNGDQVTDVQQFIVLILNASVHDMGVFFDPGSVHLEQGACWYSEINPRCMGMTPRSTGPIPKGR